MAKHRAESRPLPERTVAAINGCSALGLSFWALHPTPGHVWAVHPIEQTYHEVRVVGGTAREIGTGDKASGYPDVTGRRYHDGLVLL